MTKSSDQPQRRDCVLDDNFREDLEYFTDKNRKTALRVYRLMEAVMRTPFEGIGKPEPLKHLDPGTWSRRVTDEHRMIYLVEDDRITFLMARYCYDG